MTKINSVVVSSERKISRGTLMQSVHNGMIVIIEQVCNGKLFTGYVLHQGNSVNIAMAYCDSCCIEDFKVFDGELILKNIL